MGCHVLGNIYVRECDEPMKAGEIVDGHTHNFDHVTYCPAGALRVERLDADGNVERAIVIDSQEARPFVLIRAECRHRLTALRDGTRYHCIYSHRDPAQPDVVVQQWNGWLDASC